MRRSALGSRSLPASRPHARSWWSWRTAAACILVALLAMAGAQRGRSQSDDADSPAALEEAEPAPVTPTDPDLAYVVAIEGVDDSALRSLLDEVSETRRLIDRPPASLARLRRRAQDDRQRLLEVLRSQGYYGGQVEVDLDRDVKPIEVTFEVDLGPLYRLGEVNVEVLPPQPGLVVPSPDDVGLKTGEPAAAQTILDAEQALLEQVEAQGFILAELGGRRAIVDRDTDTMDVTLHLDPGPLTRFGPVGFEGLSAVDADFLAARLDWEEGELITPAKLAAARASLRETGLFTTAQIALDDAPDKDGLLPVTVNLIERKHRSIGLGVRYRTDEGPGGSASWEHRNFFGRGEQVEVELDGSFIGAHLIGSFRKPDFGRRNQALLVDAKLAYGDTKAFESWSARARTGLERRLGEGMTITGGVSFLLDRVDEANTDTNRFGLLSLPARFEWDRSDDRLDPSEGGRLRIDNEPFVEVTGKDLLFNKARLDYRHYFEILAAPQIVLAGRTAVGSIVGESRADIPASLRFYAGGGGSVRGFGYQLAGELDRNNDPIGGRSLFEASGEVRLRLTDTLGVVAFVDAGTVYTSTTPDFTETLRVGAGPGLRYFSPIGPLRLDVGFPLNPRNRDDSWQLYVSIGQAF